MIWRNDRPFSRFCPVCDQLTIQKTSPSLLRLYMCCQCGVQFAVFPLLVRLLRKKARVECVHMWCAYRQMERNSK